MNYTNTYCLDTIRSMAVTDKPNRIQNDVDMPTVASYLYDNFLDPHGFTAYKLSKASGIPRSRISEILYGNRRVTAETALLLSECLGTDPMMWLMLQAHKDLYWANMSMADKLKEVDILLFSDDDNEVKPLIYADDDDLCIRL